MSYSHLKPGQEIEYSSRTYPSEAERIDDLIQRPLAELLQMEKDSEEKEKAVYTELCGVGSKWYDIAKETNRIRNAMQYQRVPPVTHTSNQIIKKQDDRYEISNMVYKLTWHIYENTRYRNGKAVTIDWELTWDLCFNTPKNPDFNGSGRKIAGQTRKRFTDKAAMEKYLDGRIRAHSHLFVEISPPIPQGQEKRFFVNGCLLPGYTVDSPDLTKPDQERVEDLLSLLEEDIAEPQTAPPTPSPKSAPTHKQGKPKKRSGMSR